MYPTVYGPMRALVIREWKVETQAVDEEGNFIKIIGRSPGLVSFILSTMGIEPVTKMTVSAKSFTYETASFAGISKKIIPLTKVSSISYSYDKPWIATLFLLVMAFALGLFLIIAMMMDRGTTPEMRSTAMMVGAAIILGGTILSVLVYMLGKTMTIGVCEMGGSTSMFKFKRSVIEGEKIEPARAAQVCEVMRTLVDNAYKS